jgi:hypothetical protein
MAGGAADDDCVAKHSGGADQRHHVGVTRQRVVVVRARSRILREGPRRRLRALAGALALGTTLTACQIADDIDPASSMDEEPPVSASVLQLRRDQVLDRVEVAVRNVGSEDLRVVWIRLDVPGFATPGAIRKDSRVPAGQVVNFPVEYGDVDCPDGGDPSIGRPRVTLHLKVGAAETERKVRLVAGDEDGILDQIAGRTCAVQRVREQVGLRFADTWRLERSDGRKELHGYLLVSLRAGEERSVTQVAGAILYGLRPDDSRGAEPDPLGSVSRDRPETRIPVIAYAARCDGHTIGEIKKPYEFLVWVSQPGGGQIAVTPTVGRATKLALRKVCAF